MAGQHHEYLSGAESGDIAAFRYLDFGDGADSVTFEASTATLGTLIELRLDAADGQLIAQINIPEGEAWDTFETITAKLTERVLGTHALYLCFKGQRGRICSIQSFRFFDSP